jgi:type II secretory pathway pseudopilin PulG
LTLFEVIISISLIGLLLGALLVFFWQTLAIRDQARKTASRTQIVHQILDRMSAELQNAVASDQVGFPGFTQFTGDRRRLTFLTTGLPTPDAYAFYADSAERPVLKHDLMEVSYQLWIDPDKQQDNGDPLVGGILRTERQAMNPAETQLTEEQQQQQYQRHDLWSYELGYLEFRYYDGVEWTTQWQVAEGNALPHLVQITIGFDSLTRAELDDQDLQEFPIEQYEYRLGPDRPDPNRYSTIVRLPAADELFGARINRMLGEEMYVTGVADGNDANSGGLP